MKPRYLPLVIGLVGLGLVGCASNQTYDLKLNPEKGKTFTYATSMDAGQMKLTMDQTVKVEENDGKQVRLVSSLSNIKMNGQANAMLDGALGKMKVTATYSPDGKEVNKKVEGAPAQMGDAGGGAAAIPLPGKPVKVGDTWTGSLGGRTGAGNVTFKLLAVEQYKGKEAAKIEMISDTSKDQPQIVYVDMKSGILIELTGKMEQGGQSISFSTSLKG